MPKVNSNKTFKDAFTESMMSNAGYALNRVIKSDILIARLMWLFGLILLSAFCSMSILKTVTNYLQNEVVTKIRFINEIHTPFPTITICNLSPFDQDNLNNLKLVNNLSESLPFKYHFGTNTNIYRYYYMSNFFDMFNESERMRFSFEKTAMIYLCTYNLISRCDETDFEWYYDFYYGNCMRLNSRETLRTYKAGKIYGIHMEINIGYIYKVPWLNEKGLHIFIHNKSERISMDQGISVSLFMTSNIALSRVFNNKIEKPFSDCTEDLEASGSKYYKILTDANYTYKQSDCMDLCFSDNLFVECNCYEGTTVGFFKGKICQTVEEIKCFEQFFKKFYLFNKCDCPLECHSVRYKISTSYSQFGYESHANVHGITTDENYNDELLCLNIYYDDMMSTVIDEQKKYEWVDLFSSVGSSLGPFLGVSVLSVMEVFEFFIRFIQIIKEKIQF
jgi:hypothetical protein